MPTPLFVTRVGSRMLLRYAINCFVADPENCRRSSENRLPLFCVCERQVREMRQRSSVRFHTRFFCCLDWPLLDKNTMDSNRVLSHVEKNFGPPCNNIFISRARPLSYRSTFFPPSAGECSFGLLWWKIQVDAEWIRRMSREKKNRSSYPHLR